MSPLVALFLRTTVLPAALSALARYFAGGVREPWRARAQAFILALGYILGSFLLLERLPFPPVEVTESISYVALVLAAFVFVMPNEVGARYGLRAAFVLLAGVIVLWHLRENLFSSPVNQRNLLAFFCLALGAWSIVDRAQFTVKPLGVLAVSLIVATGISVMLLLVSSAKMSQLVTVLCGQVGVLMMLAALWPKRIALAASLPFVSVFLVMFLVAAHFYMDVNPWRLIFVCWPFVPLWIRNWLPLPEHPVAEAAGLSILSAAPLGYYLWTVFQSVGPLY